MSLCVKLSVPLLEDGLQPPPSSHSSTYSLAISENCFAWGFSAVRLLGLSSELVWVPAFGRDRAYTCSGDDLIGLSSVTGPGD